MDNEMMNELLEILKDCCPDIDFESETALVDDQILDSLSVVMIVGELNEAFGITITADDLLPENFNSVQAMYEMIERMQSE